MWVERMIDHNINERILKKLEKISGNSSELKMCERLIECELKWFDVHEPPFKRDFLQILNKYFPMDEDTNV